MNNDHVKFKVGSAMRGKKHSEETIKKMILAKKDKPWSKKRRDAQNKI